MYDVDLDYFDITPFNPSPYFPHLISINIKEDRSKAMKSVEFRHLQTFLTDFDSTVYQLNESLFSVGFLHKNDAMRFKLMWKPIEWTSIGSPGW